MVLKGGQSARFGKKVSSKFLAVTGDLVSSRRQRKRIMAILRAATRIIGIGQKARVGRLGAASVTALLAGLGFATLSGPAHAQDATANDGNAGNNGAIVTLNNGTNDVLSIDGSAIAIGLYANANGANATSVGTNANATGTQATAFGTDSIANGEFAAAFGPNAQALGSSATGQRAGHEKPAVSFLFNRPTSSSATGPAVPCATHRRRHVVDFEGILCIHRRNGKQPARPWQFIEIPMVKTICPTHDCH